MLLFECSFATLSFSPRTFIQVGVGSINASPSGSLKVSLDCGDYSPIHTRTNDRLKPIVQLASESSSSLSTGGNPCPTSTSKRSSRRFPSTEQRSSSRLEVKHSASQLRGCCPACQSDDDRALAITPSKGVFYCHAGQKGGDAIALVAHILNLGMRDAAEWLQETLPEQRSDPAPQRSERPAPVLTGAGKKAPRRLRPRQVRRQAHVRRRDRRTLSAETAKLHRIGFQRGKAVHPGVSAGCKASGIRPNRQWRSPLARRMADRDANETQSLNRQTLMSASRQTP